MASMTIGPGAVVTGTMINPATGTTGPASEQQQFQQESSLISALYGEQGAAEEATGQATAQEIEAQGDIAEEGDYTQAEAIATSNAGIALVSGQIQEYQNQRSVMATLGQQKADVAGAGFQESGTAVSLASSSYMQGLLSSQVIGMNADLQAGGFYQQAAASKAEAATAATAAQYATEMAQTDAGQAAIDTAAGNADAALLGTVNPNAADIARTIQSGGNVAQVINSTNPWNNGTDPNAAEKAKWASNPSIVGGVDSAEYNL